MLLSDFKLFLQWLVYAGNQIWQACNEIILVGEVTFASWLVMTLTISLTIFVYGKVFGNTSGESTGETGTNSKKKLPRAKVR